MGIAVSPNLLAPPTAEVLLSNRQAFRAFFKANYQPLCRFALTLVHSVEAAEEIVADVFLKMWKNRENLVIHSSLPAYLFTSVRNQSVDYLRKSNRRRTIAEEICAELPSDYKSPEEQAIAEELEQLIETSIAALPPQGQKIFRLSRDQGLKYHEIASHLGISIKTVETHMGRSLRFLREKLTAAQVF